jgi:hypothetical protein
MLDQNSGALRTAPLARPQVGERAVARRWDTVRKKRDNCVSFCIGFRGALLAFGHSSTTHRLVQPVETA